MRCLALAGVDILLTLPGVTTARDFHQVVHPDTTGCPYYNFCTWDQTGFVGDRVLYYYCQDAPMPFVSTGSYDNNQTPGTIAVFKNYYKVQIDHSNAPGQPGVSPYYWLPVYYIKPC